MREEGTIKKVEQVTVLGPEGTVEVSSVVRVWRSSCEMVIWEPTFTYSTNRWRSSSTITPRSEEKASVNAWWIASTLCRVGRPTMDEAVSI